MGSALVMVTVPEELLGEVVLCCYDKRGNVVPLEDKRGRLFVHGKKRRRALEENPNAFLMLPVPPSAIWQPPPEPWQEHGSDWHFDPALLAAQNAKVKQSLEVFLNGNLQRLDHMVRTGWWILRKARVRVSTLEEVPHAPSERPFKRSTTRPRSKAQTKTKATAVWHRHFFSPLGDEVRGRFDAVEDAAGEIYVLDVATSTIVRPCRTRREAAAAARAAAGAWRPAALPKAKRGRPTRKRRS